METLEYIRKHLHRFSEFAAVLSVCSLMVVSVYVAVDVVSRKALGISFFGTDELAGYAFAIVVGWGGCYSFMSGGMIRVDVIYVLLPGVGRAWLDVLAALATFLVATVLAYNAVELSLESLEFNNVSNTPLRLPLWMPQAAWSVGFYALAASSLLMTVETFLLALAGRHQDVIEITKSNGREVAT
jgi:TRAP-type C4-dicarboxylate transport system permease small subunit